jgi:hypothetical protein
MNAPRTALFMLNECYFLDLCTSSSLFISVCGKHTASARGTGDSDKGTNLAYKKVIKLFSLCNTNLNVTRLDRHDATCFTFRKLMPIDRR